MVSDVEPTLKRILVERLRYRIAPDRITAETPLMGKGLGLSSLDVVALVVALEETFDVVFEAEDMSGMIASFGALAAAVHAKLAAGTSDGRGAGE
jgi:acyl carrier protein